MILSGPYNIIMSYQDKTVTAQGGGGGNLVAILDAEVGAWDTLLRY